MEAVCGASIEWSVIHLACCALCGILGGTVGGLLGSGGGFILGPLLLEIGVIPQVNNNHIDISFYFYVYLMKLGLQLMNKVPSMNV